MITITMARILRRKTRMVEERVLLVAFFFLEIASLAGGFDGTSGSAGPQQQTLRMAAGVRVKSRSGAVAAGTSSGDEHGLQIGTRLKISVYTADVGRHMFHSCTIAGLKVEKNGRLVHLVRWEDGEDDEWLDMTTEVWQHDMEKNRGKSDKTLGGMLHTAITQCLPSHGSGVQETHRWGKQRTIDSFMSAGGNQQNEGGGEALLAGADGGEGQTMIKDYMKMMSQDERERAMKVEKEREQRKEEDRLKQLWKDGEGQRKGGGTLDKHMVHLSPYP